MQSSEGAWIVKVKKTGCRVGMLAMAVEKGRPVIRFARPRSLSLRALEKGEFPFPRPDRVEARLDWEKGVAWVDRADSLFGMPGYVMD